MLANRGAKYTELSARQSKSRRSKRQRQTRLGDKAISRFCFQRPKVSVSRPCRELDSPITVGRAAQVKDLQDHEVIIRKYIIEALKSASTLWSKSIDGSRKRRTGKAGGRRARQS